MNTESPCACSQTDEPTTCKTEQPAELRTVRPEWTSQETDDGVTLVVALPGVQKEDLSLSSQESQVTLKAPRSGQGEFAYELTVRLGRTLDPASAAAKLQNGVLELQFSRREEAKPRSIRVEG